MSWLDVFSIGFKSEEIKDFEKNLKTTENELDKTEKKVASLEKELEALNSASNKDEKAIARVEKSLKGAKDEAAKFENQVKIMKGHSQYQVMQMKKSFVSLMKTLGLLTTVTLAVRQSLQFYEQAEQLDVLAQKSNIALDSLQRLGKAAQRYGGTTESTASVVEQFSTKEFQEKAVSLGITVAKDNPEQTLENIAAKMETLKTDAQKWELAKNIGLDEATTRILIGGVERYREELKRANKYKLYTKEDVERMKDYRQVQQDIRMGIQSIQATIARVLLPAITAVAKIIRGVTDWLAQHEGAVKIATLFIVIATAIGATIMAVKMLNGALAMLMANPVVLWIMAITAAIVLVIAVINDFIVFLQGGDSVIGRILKKMNVNVDEVRNTCLQFFAKLREWVDMAVNGIKNFGNKISEFAQKVKALWDALPDPIKKLIGLANPFTATFTTFNIAKDMLNKANNNKLNAASQSAISNYNQTEALTNNNNANTKTLTNNNTKNVNVNIGTITTQAKDGKELAGQLSTVADMDNGFAA